MLRQLAAAFDITALCFERAATAGSTSPDIRGGSALGDLGSVEVFRIPQRHSRMRFLYDHLRSLLLGRVYTTFVYDSRAFRRRLGALLQSTRFDLVHVDSLDLARYLPALTGVPVVGVHHDIESALLRRRADVEPNAWRQAYFRYQSERMQEVEQRWCPRLALNVTMSEHDRDRLVRLAPGSRVAVVPNGVDTAEFRPAVTPGSGVAFVGGTNPFPNLDALNFFALEVLPHLRAGGFASPITWIGRASDRQRRDFAAHHGIQLTGYVRDVRPFLNSAACHIVPIRIGGGTRVKILNSWAMGKPVISTSVGCEGLAAVDGENLLIRDEPRAFADAILSVLHDPGLRQRLGRRARRTAEHYSWDAIGQSMIHRYLSLGAKSRVGN